MKTNGLNHLPGPDSIIRRELNNGIVLLVRENPSSNTAAVIANLPCGSYLDPMDKTGLADIMSNLLNNGTQSHDFNQLSELLESSGASLSVGCGPRALTFQGACLAEDLEMLLGILKEVLDEPLFPQEQVEIHRHRVLSAYELHLHDPETMANESFDRLLFGPAHPYGRPEFGTPEEINTITRDDLLEFHRRYIGPEKMVLAITGGIDADKAIELCEKQLGTWQKPQEQIHTEDYFPSVPAPDHAISEHIEIPEKSEMELILGTMAPNRGSEDYLAVVLGNSILGEFGMMGRIGQAVREKNGLAYYAGSSFTSLSYGGCWTVEAGVNPANLEKAVELIQTELRRFTSQKVRPEELEDVKSYYIGSLPLSLESNSGMAALMISLENHQLGLDYVQRLPEMVNRVTSDDILAAAQKWLDPEKLIRVTAGTGLA